MGRSSLIAVVEKLAAGAREPARHTHVECCCPDQEHVSLEPTEGCCFCPDCAAAEAIALGMPATDTRHEAEGADDRPEWCAKCGRLITLRSSDDIAWGVSPDGALEELEHFETGLGFERGEPKTPDDWMVFLLMVDTIAEEHLPRVEALVRLRAAGVLPGGEG